MRDLSQLSPEDATFFRERGYLPQTPETTKRLNEWALRLREELGPHQGLLDREFTEWRDEMDRLFARDHNAIGRVLKHHLILEHYITRHLEAVAPGHDWSRARLRFGQKVDLIPQGNEIIEYLVPGIREINAIRNRLGHQINAQPSLDSLNRCIESLGIIHPYCHKTYSEAVDVIEDFTAMVCRWLPVQPETLRIFREAEQRAQGSAKPTSSC